MRRNKKKIIIISLIGILFLMVVGYAAFNTNLQIRGTSKINSNWDIRITNVREGEKSGDAESAKEPTWNELTANIEANLYKKGDFIEYIITVENRGTIDAILNNVSSNKTGNEAIKFTYSGVNKNDKLYKGESTQIKVKIEYNPEFSGTIEVGSSDLKIELDYIQAVVGGIEELNPNLYVSSSGNDEEGIGSKEKPYKTIKKAYEEAKEESTIYIMDDIVQTETLNFNEEKTITLTSYGVEHSIIRGNSLTEYFMVMDSGTLTLENIIIDGNNVEAQYANISLNGTSIVNLNSGSVVKNAVVNGASGAGIKLWDKTYSTLNINGGSVINNKSINGLSSGGIHAGPTTKIIMNSGLVSKNSAAGNGGAISVFGELEINGGTISDNSAQTGGAINMSCWEGNCGKTTIQNGMISNNTASNIGGAIYTNVSTTLIINGGTISDNEATTGHGAGGIHVYGNLTMTNGIIKNNIASGNATNGYGNGGGIVIQNTGVANISGGKIINNKANRQGGGITVTGNDTVKAKLTLSGSVLIDGNSATAGGGFLAWKSNVDIKSGIISNNKVTSNGAGGVYSSSTGIFDGGIVKNNIATISNGGIESSNSTFTFKSGIICGNKPTNSFETHATCPAS